VSCRAEWLVDVKTMADRIISMRHKLKEGLAREGESSFITVGGLEIETSSKRMANQGQKYSLFLFFVTFYVYYTCLEGIACPLFPLDLLQPPMYMLFNNFFR
jgi:hypothetical protein